WSTTDAQGEYINPPTEHTGKNPWFSLHDAEDTGDKGMILANRGFVIRSWKAKLGGKDASPWVGEYGVYRNKKNFSILDITPPDGLSELLPGDYVDAVIEYIVMPKKAAHYYGPNKQLKAALKKAANTGHMIFREAKYNSHQVKMVSGKLQHTFPDLRVETVNNKAHLKFNSGLGYVPFTFTGLTSHAGYSLQVNGKKLDQSVHGNDFWQTDFDFKTQTWSITYNVPITARTVYDIKLVYTP
ncbi:hypothetical protein OAI07_02380, partial [Akkermansiaceae bacterium]|nr:hypothetical protein [Akkermansiaceae bacterium]